MFNPHAYRTNLGWRNYLGISVLAHGTSTPVDGVVKEVNMDAISVIFPGLDEAPDLRAGDSVTVRLTASWLPRALVTGATLGGSSQEAEGTVFEFEFTSPGSIEEQITPVLHAIFNRRVAPRVSPNEDDDVRVAVHPHGGERVTGRMHQISSTGISIYLRPQDAEPQRVGGPVWLAFFLPGRDEPVKVLAHLRNKRPGERAPVLGYEFDPATPEFARIQGALFGFILTRAPVRDPIFAEKQDRPAGGSGSQRRRLA